MVVNGVHVISAHVIPAHGYNMSPLSPTLSLIPRLSLRLAIYVCASVRASLSTSMSVHVCSSGMCVFRRACALERECFSI